MIAPWIWVALGLVVAIALAIIWAGLHAPRRRWPRNAALEPDAVTHCKLCGPTAAAIQPSGLCWKCEPHAEAARFNYGGKKIA